MFGFIFCFFFFQAEDGIRDLYVTGVQTCALPILIPIDLRLVVDGPDRQRVERLVRDRELRQDSLLDRSIASSRDRTIRCRPPRGGPTTPDRRGRCTPPRAASRRSPRSSV